MTTELTGWAFGFAYLVPLAIGALMLAMPALTRGSTFFAVTVPPGFPDSPAGRSIKRTYRIGTLVAVLISLAIITPVWWWLDAEPALAVAHTVGALGASFGAVGVFVHCRSRAMAFSQSRDAQRSIELAPPDRLGDIVPRPYWLHALPYLPVLAAWLWVAMHAGNPTIETLQDASLSDWEVHALPLIMFFTLAFMHLIMPLGLLIRRLPGHRSRVEAINRMLLWMMGFSGVMGGWNTLSLLYGEDWTVGTLGTIVNVGCILGTLLVPIAMWRAGSFARPGQPEQGDRSPDSAWKLGLFYFNPDDPALWLEKRFGVGYTLNFGRPAAWIIIGSILGATAALVLLTVPWGEL